MGNGQLQYFPVPYSLVFSLRKSLRNKSIEDSTGDTF